MSDGPTLVFEAVGVLVGVGVSCLIARAAAGGPGVSPWWGLLGPPGWFIAAVRGAHVRLDELRDLAVTQERVQRSAAAKSDADAVPQADRIVGEANPAGQVIVACAGCHERQRLYPETGLTAPCIRCGRTIPNFSRRSS